MHPVLLRECYKHYILKTNDTIIQYCLWRVTLITVSDIKNLS